MRHKVYVVLSLLIMAGMAIAACTQPTQAPVLPTQIPVASPVPPAVPTIIVVTNSPEPPPEIKSKDPTTYVRAMVSSSSWVTMIDPALSYTPEDSEIIVNTHDTLIFYNRQDPNSFVPMLALEVPSLENGGISADGQTYTFNIRKGARFHDGTEMTPSDVAYTFQRGLLQGSALSPQFLLAEPFLGAGIMDIAEVIEPTGSLDDDPVALAAVDPQLLQDTCKKVTDAIVADDAAGTVTMRLAQPWGPFLATLANSWGAITSKDWISSKGGWDGDCRTWQNFYGKTAEQLIELGLGNSENGTGPFKLEAWTPEEEIVLVANEDYWVKEPLWEGGPSGAPKLKKVIFKFINDFSLRFAMLEAGDVDQIFYSNEIEKQQMDTLVGVECQETTDNCQEIDPDKPLMVIKGLQGTERIDMFFSFEINAEENALIGSGKLDGNGIPPNFFSDPLVRKGFAYCFNYDTYLNDALLGEGVRSVNVMLPGMLGYDETTPIYTHDPAKCIDMLKQSRWKNNADGSWTPDPAGDVFLWDVGFRFTALYHTGALSRQVSAQILKAELNAINNKFVVEVTGVPFDPTYYDNSRAQKIPLFLAGWKEDIHDPHNWVVPVTIGSFGARQGLPVDVHAAYAEIIQRAILESDPERRAEIYKEFNQFCYDTASVIPLFVPTNKSYQPRWLQGWYYNPIYPGTYFYSLWKE
jgi:peptide/nickel transport system substrate-binding protein